MWHHHSPCTPLFDSWCYSAMEYPRAGLPSPRPGVIGKRPAQSSTTICTAHRSMIHGAAVQRSTHALAFFPPCPGVIEKRPTQCSTTRRTAQRVGRVFQTRERSSREYPRIGLPSPHFRVWGRRSTSMPWFNTRDATRDGLDVYFVIVLSNHH